ncbi:HlyD family secretion protein [Loktanella fryxellensis]|uniref:Membrane fusion protein (MFP) family protein n=1 Tax=Loktanella fryxellensis TaxID=245187 RepID=A0A1H8DHY0_9RHOB|nr:HlyD family type I secretion periplasmic adaptor subunit [Loktanella fryxellensis]SEN06766.1 HlyD family secretion protein [Loktanella fryxellensis]
MTPQPAQFSARAPRIIGLCVIGLLIAGFGGWAMTAQISGAVMAAGRVVVEQNRQAVQHLDGGRVAAVIVKEGDTVAAGDVLLELDPTVAQSELAIIENQLYELMARRGRLEAERDGAAQIAFDPELVALAARDPHVDDLVEGQLSLFEARRDTQRRTIEQFHNQQAQLVDQIAGVDAQMSASDRQIALVGTEATVQQSLVDRQLAPIERILTLQREDARLSGLQGELMARRAQAMERRTEIDLEILRLQTERREEAITTLRDISVPEAESAERRATLIRQLAFMQVRAQVSGIVYDIKVFGPGAVIRPADALLFIVPQDRPLVIAARVDPIDVDKIRSELDVVLRFPTFNLSNTPDLLGKVTRISPDAFTDPATGRTFYAADISLAAEELEKLAEGQILVPGMPVDCFIDTGAHTPFAYLTDPLVRYFSRAMRETS